MEGGVDFDFRMRELDRLAVPGQAKSQYANILWVMRQFAGRFPGKNLEPSDRQSMPAHAFGLLP
ncbi:MAG: hypothetical protein ACD_23C01034G0004 [uncultured bacterium]|nr:MAG: hypothetical protein ACD_23C01034G0004 [uncultured bacterium]